MGAPYIYDISSLRVKLWCLAEMLNLSTYEERIGINIHTFTNNHANVHFHSYDAWSDERKCRIGSSYIRVMTSGDF